MEQLAYSFPILNEIHSIWKDSGVFENKNLFAVQPIFEDTFQCISKLQEAGLKIDQVIGLTYSSDPGITDQFKEKNIDCKVIRTEDIDKVVKIELQKALENVIHHKRKLVILENGGFVTPIFHKYFHNYVEVCCGGVEETAQGFWRTQKVQQLLFPVFQVARTPLKKIESQHIGEAVVSALGLILKKIGIGIQGKQIGVLGFGWIGSSVARYFKQNFAAVKTYDTDPIKNLEAYYLGFGKFEKSEILKNSEIIVGSSGKQSISKNDFLQLKDGVFLASSSSKKVEFDLKSLEELTISKFVITDQITLYQLKNGKRLFLILNGEPINFLVGSLSDEIMDMMMANMYNSVALLCKKHYPPGLFPAPLEEERKIAQIALNR